MDWWVVKLDQRLPVFYKLLIQKPFLKRNLTKFVPMYTCTHSITDEIFLVYCISGRMYSVRTMIVALNVFLP